MPIAFVIIGAYLMCFPAIAIYTIELFSCCGRLCSGTDAILQPFWSFVNATVKFIYGEEFVIHQNGRRPTLYGQDIPGFPLTILFSAIVFVFCCALLSFWTEFLLNETDTCTPDMDCFAVYTNYTEKGVIDYLKTSPINFEKCSEYEHKTNYTIRCFRFVFDYAGALGNSGGVIVLAKISMNLHTLLWAKAVSLKRTVWLVLAVLGVTVIDLVCSGIIVGIAYGALREAFTILSVHDVINHNFFISLSRQLKLNQSVVY